MMDKVEEYEELITKVMIDQPVINLGVIGHVANGKSSLVKALTGVSTQKHSSELKRNITVRLGYANGKIWKCTSCKEPMCFQPTSSDTYDHLCVHCKSETHLVIHFSLVDCPGHNTLTETMLNGTCLMDYTILVESCANETIPAIQTAEHYSVTKEVGIKTIFSCLNKCDLFSKEREKIKDSLTKLRNFINDDDVPLIPTCCTTGLNIDVICHYITQIPIPIKDVSHNTKMLVIRTFNINLPDTKIISIKGGVIGGSLVRGIIKIGDTMKIFPGFIKMKEEPTKDDSVWFYKPLECKVINIHSDKNKLHMAIPGGLIGVELDIDPALCGSNKLVGNVVFKDGFTNTVNVFEEIKVEYNMIMSCKIILNKKDIIHINVNSNNVKCEITKVRESYVILKLEKPVCVELGDKISMSIHNKDDKNKIFIFGSGVVVDGFASQLKL